MNDIHASVMQKSRVYLFDFDGTIFNTQQLKLDISQELKKYTNDVDLIWRTEKRLRDQKFHLVETMYSFCKQIGREDTHHRVQEIFLTKQFRRYVYEDVIKSLPSIHMQAVTAIFTQGDESYQQVKIYQSGVNEYFDFIYIYQQKMLHLKEILNFFDQKEVWLVDNQLPLLQTAKSEFPSLKTVWMNRDGLTPMVEFQPDKTISSCNDLLQFTSV